MATHYERLGVAPEASAEEIQRAYRLLALRHHPDVAPDADQAAMAAINAAWAVLGDPDRRRTYDTSIDHARPTDPPPGAARPTEPGGGWSPLDPDTDDEDPADLSDEPYEPVDQRPTDLLVMMPVLVVAAAVGLFFFSTMSGSAGLRTLSILLVPVAGLGFVMAPLFVMLRSRSRSDR